MEPEFNESIAARFGDAEEQTIDFLGLPLFDGPGLWRLLILFGINLLVCWIITHFFYYHKSRRRDYYFTYMLFSTAIFFILLVAGSAFHEAVDAAEDDACDTAYVGHPNPWVRYSE